ncbi:MAG TPA: hypothetical protein VIT91_04970 [Chthoniobacterales bacterium]
MNLSSSVITPLIAVFLIFAGTHPVLARRAEPKSVEPVVIGSVRYSVSSSRKLMGFVIAVDVFSGKELWRQRIYRVPINPFLERDAQWVFITSLARRGQTLLIGNERGKYYTLDLITRKVTMDK